MRAQLLARVDELVERAAAERSLGKKQFLNSCGVAPASYYRWRESMQKGGRWEIPGWLLELITHSVGADLPRLFSDLSAMPWSLWPDSGTVTVIVGSEDSPPQPLIFQRIAERDLRATGFLIDGLRRRTNNSWSVEIVAISPSESRHSDALRERVRHYLRKSICVAAIGSPAVNPAVDVLATEYIFAEAAPPFRFRYPISIQGSLLSDPRPADQVGIFATETGEMIVTADALERIATTAENVGTPFPCSDGALLVVDQRRRGVADDESEAGRFDLPILILCMGVAAAGTEGAVRALFEESAPVDGFLRSATPDTPQGLLFEPIDVACEKPPGSRRDDMKIVSVAFSRKPGAFQKADRTTQASRG
jgi:hypothetical protein